MIVNYYIQLPNYKNKETELFALQAFLLSRGYQVFDATRYDSLTSGHCKVDTLEQIENELSGRIG